MGTDRIEGEISTDEAGNVVIGAPTAEALAPVSVPTEADEEVND